MPSPVDTGEALIELIRAGSIIDDTIISVYRVIIGFLIGSSIAFLIALPSVLSSAFRTFISPVVELLRPIPPVAFVPLAILWFGIGDAPAFFLVAFAAFFPVFTSTMTGLDAVSSNYVDAARTMGADRAALIRHVYLPAASPSILAGLRTGMGTSWFVLIVAELVGAQSGLGYFIQLNRLTLQSDRVVAGMIVIGVIGYVMIQAMAVAHARFSRWQRAPR